MDELDLPEPSAGSVDTLNKKPTQPAAPTVKPKQVILVRTDLGMGPGKIGAQAAHASMKVFFDRSVVQYEMMHTRMTDAMIAWKEGEFTKIVLEVKSEAELLSYYGKAVHAGLPAALIEDNGHTVFNGVKTMTCAAIGPAEAADIDAITKRLRLLK